MACWLLLKTVSDALFIPKATIYKLQQKNEPIATTKKTERRGTVSLNKTHQIK